jgi:hypothetical protein
VNYKEQETLVVITRLIVQDEILSKTFFENYYKDFSRKFPAKKNSHHLPRGWAKFDPLSHPVHSSQ